MPQTSQKLEPGKFIVHQMIILSVQNIDIRHHYEEINIYEDLFTSTYHGTIVVSDAVNLISGSNALPILGHEDLLIRLEIPNVNLSQKNINNPDFEEEESIDVQNRFINLAAKITNIESRKLFNEGTQQYIIHFIQEELIMDQKTRISKSYMNMTYKNMINLILNELSPDNNRKILEDTRYTYNFISPNWHPLKAVNWLTQRSIPTRYSGSSFFFYTTIYNKDINLRNGEETNYFFLRSLEDMLVDDIQRRIFFIPANIRSEVKPTYDAKDFSNITTYEVISSFDILDNLNGGFYANKLITHDIINKKYNVTTFNYEDSFPLYKHLHKGKQLGIKLDYFNRRLSDYPDANIKMYSKDNALSENHIEKVTHSKLSQLMSIHNFRIRFILPGDGRTSVGDKVKFIFPSPEEKPGEKDRFYTGKYLVTSIRHVFRSEKYEVAIECAKETYKTDVNEFTPVALKKDN